MRLLDAVTTGTGTARDISDLCSPLSVYVFWTVGVTAGQVVIETAHEQGYTGTWSPLGVFNANAGCVDYLPLMGPYGAIRGRVTTTVAGTSPAVSMEFLEGGRFA